MKLKHLQHLNIRDYFKSDKAICVVRKMRAAPSNTFIAMHDHEFSEIALVARGALTHLYSGGSVRMKAGDFFVIHPGMRHGYADLEKDTVVFNCLYNPDRPPPGHWILPARCQTFFFPAKDCRGGPLLTGSLSEKDLEHAVQLISIIQAEGNGHAPLAHDLETSLFSSVLLLLVRKESERTETAPHAVRTAMDHINAHLDRRVTLDELCRVSGCSAATMNRLFRDKIGLSPCAYALRRRIDKARALIAEQRLPLSVIAHETGFFDASHLSRALQNPAAARCAREGMNV
jgi:AraC-like DNA-binding protein/mannose-6-phosphate isomerase-like protein (cupin superfamily)